MKLFEFAGPAIMILIITSFVSHQIGNNNPGDREIAMQEFSWPGSRAMPISSST